MAGYNYQMPVTKASGEKAAFSSEKLRRSLQRAGAGEETITRIEREIESLLYPGITTKEIYRKAFSLLKKTSAHLAARYKLKNAIFEFGPSGFPFEKYMGEILKYEGHRVQVGQIVLGRCVQHEVDVIAEKDDRKFLIECKFHSDQGRKCDVKIPLYIRSRFLDVKDVWEEQSVNMHKVYQGWVVTNTRFTTDALRYGLCTGMNLVSWDFPRDGDSLKSRIDRSGLHPLTCLTTLTKKEKQLLLDKGIVLCKELCQNEQMLRDAGVHPSRIPKVMEEARLLCETKILV